ncbi:MAG TPA: hypothetical protein VGI99_00070 [Gemmataceae bacterium]
MPAPLQLAGQRQPNGYLEAIRPNKRPGHWDCKCHACGGPAVVSGTYFKREHTRSCGCLQRAAAAKLGREQGGKRWQTIPPKSLIGKRFGKLKVLCLDEERSATRSASGTLKRHWHCKCDCGNEVSAQQANLTSGHTQSCGRCTGAGKNLPTSAEKFAEYKAAETIKVDDETYFAPRKAARYLGKPEHTLRVWKVSCPWLNGEGIKTTEGEGAFAREYTYYLKAALDRIKDAMRKPAKPQAPEGKIHFADACLYLGISDESLRRQLRKQNPPVIPDRVVGLSAYGHGAKRRQRAVYYAYLDRELVEKLKHELYDKPPGVTREELIERFGFATVESKKALGSLLSHWSKTGELPTQRSRSHRGPATHHYDAERAQELLAGRDILTMAAELEEYGAISSETVAPASPSQPMQPTATPEDYITGKQACITFEILKPALSKLCKSGGPVRFQKPAKNRLLVHAGDLARYLASDIEKS